MLFKISLEHPLMLRNVFQAFQFCGEIRQNLEKAIGYKLRKTHVDIEEFLVEHNYVKLNSEGVLEEEDEFIFFCNQNMIDEFKSGKSCFLEEALDLMQSFDENKNPISVHPEQIVKKVWFGPVKSSNI
jgi:hypothetical protein